MDQQTEQLGQILKLTEQNAIQKKHELKTTHATLEREREFWLKELLSVQINSAKLEEELLASQMRVDDLYPVLENKNYEEKVKSNELHEMALEISRNQIYANDYVKQMQTKTSSLLSLEHNYNNDKLSSEIKDMKVEVDITKCEHEEIHENLKELSNKPIYSGYNSEHYKNLLDVTSFLENKLLSKPIIEQKLKDIKECAPKKY